jgi:PKD repeat protein
VAYDWNFGDNVSASGRTTNHAFGSNGSYSVTLTVRDDSGTSSTTARQVTVSSGDLVAAFTYSPTNPTGAQVVQFNGSDSTSVFGITKYAWNFGDGSASGSNRTVGHAFAGCTTNAANDTDVTFVVRLTVMDGMNRYATATQEVTVMKCKP